MPRSRDQSSKQAEIDQAVALFEEFTGQDSVFVDEIDMPELPQAVAVIGEVDGILYHTVRDGKRERYIHRFKRGSRPLFTVSPDGTLILLIGGRYEFTGDRGIVDK